MSIRPTPAGILALALVLVTALSCGKDKPADRTDEIGDRLEKLRSVPYTSMTQEEVSADTAGVILYDMERAWPGYNLYCSRRDPEALLLNMGGEVVHSWTYKHKDARGWDHAMLLGNGDLLVLDKFRYFFKLDWHSNLIWEKRLAVHHDVAVAEDGTVFVIELNTERHRGLRVRFARIVHLSADGEEIGAWSTYEHLEDLKKALDRASFLDTILDLERGQGTPLDTTQTVGARMYNRRKGGRGYIYDYFHMNTITLVPETPLGARDPRFAAGNLLICLRNVNQIATLDRETGDILWAWGEGVLEWPHHPTMLPNGNILIFDNGIVRGHSRVLEIEPASGTVVWEYTADPPESFFTPQKGSSQRLPNGNTLICEGDRGRVFEVTMNGEKVWEWYNPVVVDGHRLQLYRMMRYPPEMVEPLLGRPDR